MKKIASQPKLVDAPVAIHLVSWPRVTMRVGYRISGWGGESP
jgi:hypothetical protein